MNQISLWMILITLVMKDVLIVGRIGLGCEVIVYKINIMYYIKKFSYLT
jgi:hypothetical protein